MASLTPITADNVLNALRVWHGGDVDRWPLAHLRLGLVIRDQQEVHGSLAEMGAATINRAILNYGLKRLREQSPEAEDLLRERFEHRRDVLSLANSLNVSESSLYYRQRQAVNQLTSILCTLENEAGHTWQEKMIARLPLPSHFTLVGVDTERAQLLDALTSDDNTYILVVDGIGGIGKTALANQIARDLTKTTHFNEIAWVTAKHTHLSTLGRLQVESGRPALTFAMLVDKLVTQFELSAQTQATHLQKQRQLNKYLQENACLIVIDNLETVADYRSLLPELRKWQKPTHFLLTSRLRLIHEPGIMSLSLTELNLQDAIRLMRIEASETGFSALADASDDELAQIYEVVGGNPLALKLIMGQLRFHSMSRVLRRFSQSVAATSREGIFDYIYQEIWDSLDDNTKTALLALTHAGESGFTFDHIAALTELPETILSQSLEQLILLSLVDLEGSLFERRYRLHRLTEVFLLRTFAE